MKAKFKAIPNGLLNMLAKLTSRIEDNSNVSIRERYPDHANSLPRPGLGMKNFPTLKSLWENADGQGKRKRET